MTEKVVLAFSGGLDTSFCLLYLKEKKFDVITATVDTGGLSKEELKYIENRSKKLGAIKHYFVDAKKEIFDEIISYIIKANALYEGVYPLMCSDRYTIAKHLIEIAAEEKASAVAHGCTGAGNDQVRIDITTMCLAPDLKIIAPIRELGIRRPQEIEYLEKKGFSVKNATKKYTINENVFGRTISGSEIDENKEPSEEVWVLTKVRKREPEYVKISFEKGVPVALDGKKMHGIEILQKLNEVAGAHGYGRGLYVEDETVGIKGFQAFEAPGLLLLIEAHRALERLVLTRHQLATKTPLESTYADMSYRGLFYEPLVRDIEAFMDSTQKVVTGETVMKLDHMSAIQVSVSSPYSLVREDVARYAQMASWKGADAEAFIKLYGLQQKIACARKKGR
ncbi:MAG: argininosuccinate synthase [Candidatus Hodarchaeaceae archaeon]|nr:argininosuccinate synthase [Candidatus Hodarchaeaceae archaeon]